MKFAFKFDPLAISELITELQPQMGKFLDNSINLLGFLSVTGRVSPTCQTFSLELQKQSDCSQMGGKSMFPILLLYPCIKLLSHSLILQSIMRASIFLLSLLCVLAISQNLPPQNPVIGIFTQTHTNTPTSKTSYIAASYVKFIEMSGAQVVPIYSFSDTTQVLALMGKINGVLFPGGGMEFNLANQWTTNADAILKFAKEQNDQGNPFPVFGTCLGAQLLSFLTSNYNSSILTRVHGDQAIIHPINLVAESYLFSTFTPTQKEKFTKGNGVMYFNHNWAVSLDTYNTNSYLKNFWNLVSTATSPQNERFVAAVEAKKYPFYGVQFHPEKNLFEWKVYADRSLEGAEVVQIISNRFVEIARKNKNRFSSPDEFTKASIYNFNTVTTDASFTEIYVFNETPRMVDE